MKKAKIGWVVLILLFAAAAFGFWRGWVQFSVGIDECGVLVSKTGGVYSHPIVQGHFLWRWEPLLPTNARLLTFSTQSVRFERHVRGALPSADLYSLQIRQAPDFTYEFAFDIDLQLTPESLVALVRERRVRSHEELSDYLERGADRIAALSAQFLLAESARAPLIPLSALATEQIAAGIKATAVDDAARVLGDTMADTRERSDEDGTDMVAQDDDMGILSLDGIQLRGIAVRMARVPDFDLYDRAKATYDGFQSLVDDELATLARRQAESIVSDNRAVNRLTKIGETLKKYPELSDVLKNGDTAAALRALDTLQ